MFWPLVQVSSVIINFTVHSYLLWQSRSHTLKNSEAIILPVLQKYRNSNNLLSGCQLKHMIPGCFERYLKRMTLNWILDRTVCTEAESPRYIHRLRGTDLGNVLCLFIKLITGYESVHICSPLYRCIWHVFVHLSSCLREHCRPTDCWMDWMDGSSLSSVIWVCIQWLNHRGCNCRSGLLTS